MKTSLVLLPNLLDESQDAEHHFSPAVFEAVQGVDALIAESEKGGRRYLMRFKPETFRNVPIYLLNDHSTDDDVDELIGLIAKGGKWGLVSDCGLPCIADPGARLVKRAHDHKLGVEVLPGPSSIIHALMLSGLSNQSFSFQGYLTRKSELVKPTLHSLEKKSSIDNLTQIFIEAPYRSKKLLQFLVTYLAPSTTLSIAWNVSMPNQGVLTKTVAEWKSAPLPDLAKTPAVFLFKAQKHSLKRPDFKQRRKMGFVNHRKRKRKSAHMSKMPTSS